LNVRKLTSHLLPRLLAVAFTFMGALLATSVWRIAFPQPSPPDSSTEVVGILTPAIGENPWPEPTGLAWGELWIFRREEVARELNINQPVAVPTPDANVVRFGCVTPRIVVNAERRLYLNTDEFGSIQDPSRLTEFLTKIFAERETHRAYKPGMEHRPDLPPHERIEKTVVVLPSAELTYGELMELLSRIERTGANPIVLQFGDETQTF
jgi:hypothetical protein